jgi:TPR repeat protein
VREDGPVARLIALVVVVAALFAGAVACEATTAARCTHTNLQACQSRCESGHGESCAIAATISDPQDKQRAAAYFLKSCLHGYAAGCYGAGLGFTLRSPASLEMAARSFEAGCQLGHMDSCAMRSAVHEMVQNENPQAAFVEYDRTCAAGSAVGCSLAGDRLVAGRNMAADEALGMRFLSRACELGESTACERLKKPAAQPAPPVDGGAGQEELPKNRD